MMTPTEKLLLMNRVEHDLREAFELLAIYNIQNNSEYEEEFRITHDVYYRVYARSSHLRNEIMGAERVQAHDGCKEGEMRENDADAEEKPDRDLAHIMRLEREMSEKDDPAKESHVLVYDEHGEKTPCPLCGSPSTPIKNKPGVFLCNRCGLLVCTKEEK